MRSLKRTVSVLFQRDLGLARANRLGLVLAAGAMVATLGCQEDSESPAAPEPAPAFATTSTSALAFNQVSAGGVHSCGLTTDNRAYCWGYNGSGQLGDGSGNSGPELCSGAVGPFGCSTRPFPVAGGFRFRHISAGDTYTCAVTTEFRPYCWGSNGAGQLGDGRRGTNRLSPGPVAGGHQFRQVQTNMRHTCGVSYPDNRAYCWGANSEGQLGDGTLTDRSTPVPVVGSLRFRQLSVGQSHTCGIGTDGRTYCWGWNRYGQIGDRSEVRRRVKPTLVADGHQFRQLDAGADHTCAVTTDNKGFCWGNGRSGALGNGRTYLSFWPRRVSGGLSFERVSGGDFHTCGETTSNRAYCWGNNSFGRLGDGTTNIRLTPVPVQGGLSFAQVSAGGDHTCGKTSADAAYCWGYNFFGQLGDGSTTNRSTPVAVIGP
jgi:alpha-tubulin suppressor-like RCC1 family protein